MQKTDISRFLNSRMLILGNTIYFHHEEHEGLEDIMPFPFIIFTSFMVITNDKNIVLFYIARNVMVIKRYFTASSVKDPNRMIR